ncbi:MAG: cupin domain-containing protein [Opitutaceae bacterium]|nr:cupin domain-containing protein [Opitutaceae bacterium]
MKRTHLPTLPEEEQRSPTGKYRSFCKNISVALGNWRRPGDGGESHPFDVQIRRIPAGAAICPYHSHATQWEMFHVISGSGTVRVNGELHPIAASDVFLHRPHTPHQTTNTGSDDLLVFIITNNPETDIFHYPDSNKWGLRPHGKYFRITEVDYFDGEDVVATSPAHQATVPPLPPTSAFKKVNLAELPWEPWQSPKGKFRATGKEISVALGAVWNADIHHGGHPFDLEYAKIPAGHSGCPYHSHATQSELFVILAGAGTVRAGDQTLTVTAGDVILHPPGEAHQLINSGTEELVYLLVADNPPADYWYYPDSNKWGIRSPRKIFRPQEVDYWEGEE